MTESKHSMESVCGSKNRPKKAVSFKKGFSESSLQCGDKRRRYLRRGSKTPVMLIGQPGNFKKALEELALEDLRSRLFDEDMSLLKLLSAFKLTEVGTQATQSLEQQHSPERQRYTGRRHSLEMYGRISSPPRDSNP